jgi:formylglycine-generating enzyme required for sulfatase activity
MKTHSLFACGTCILLSAWTGWAGIPVLCTIEYQVEDPTNRVVISWTATPTNRYDIRSTTDLGQPWVVLNTEPVLGTNTAMVYEDVNDLPQRFYQVINRDIPSNMVWIPPGVFTMGSPTDEVERDTDEGPLTTVTISQGFWIGRHEVTQAEYLGVMGLNPSRFPNNLSQPVEQVDWSNAVVYCTNLTDLDRTAGRLPLGYEYQLPTDAQWEYACRAGTVTRFSFGDDLQYTELGKYAWYSGNAAGQTHPVGTKAPNAWGLCDMHGNVWEWVWDWYAGGLPGGSVTDPTGPASGSVRVLRGGGWGYVGRDCRSACRSGAIPSQRNSGIGFRVVIAPVRP